jgi:5-methylcytosine-specific restriction endonuclease McrA
MDHLIPQSLFQALLLPSAVANQDANRVACCWECNQLKRDWLLGSPMHPAWRSRSSYMELAVKVVTGRRTARRHTAKRAT